MISPSNEKMSYVYMYGMVLTTNSIVLEGDYPVADSYSEIAQRKHHIGGETGTACSVLHSLGVPLKIAGSHIGNNNKDMILDFFNSRHVDTRELTYEDFDGVEDNVIIAGDTRTCFGTFAKLYSRKEPFYSMPVEESVKNCDCMGFDPFDNKAAEYAVKYGKKYATIDCRHDSYNSQHCEINAVSHEFIDSQYPDMKYEDVLRLYTDNTEGLVIITLGSKGAMYGRKGQTVKYFKGFKVKVVSTLGAGDCFKAGTVYGMYKGFDDNKLVQYACAIAATACTKFPASENPPTVQEVEKLIAENK